MKTFSEYSSKLSPHIEFDPRAFIGTEDIPQELCNFILALALAYNDYKDYSINYHMHLNSEPKGKPQRNSAWGEYAGIKFHIIRLHIAFVHELFKLIQNNKKILKHSFFEEIIRVLNKKARKSWTLLIDIALADESAPKKSNPLHMIRNKVAFHYDAKELLAGYKKGFFENGEILENACISLGNTIENARFYFADRAIQAYVEKGLNADMKSFIVSFGKIMRDINVALYNICVRFIQRRGFAWRRPH
ncbi:hypothetical protein KJA13_04120 [Patescibacteria group bacterium]|nr:hypothetical protein [Patescibacteria group bacterium]